MLRHRSDDFKLDYCDSFLSNEESKVIYNFLFHDMPKCNKRTAWIYGDKDYQVTIRNQTTTYNTNPWLDYLLIIKYKLEKFILIEYDLNIKFNVCVIQQYPSGKHEIKPHRDKEMNSYICGISLGQERTLTMYKTYGSKPILSQTLKNGSLYIIDPITNKHYLHAIPKDNSLGLRFSLTFRYI